MATALGGGYLALFASHTIYSYASTIDDVVQAFSRTTKVDASKLPDDSCGRGEYWANFATGVGAALHELGHTFGCPHTLTGIMARGFDNFNRFFLISEPNYSEAVLGSNQGGAFWHDDSIKILLAGKHFKPCKAAQNGKWLNVSLRVKRAEQFWIQANTAMCEHNSFYGSAIP